MIGIATPPDGDGSAYYLLPCDIQKNGKLHKGTIFQKLRKRTPEGADSYKFEIEVDCKKMTIRYIRGLLIRSNRTKPLDTDGKIIDEVDFGTDDSNQWEKPLAGSMSSRAAHAICEHD